MSDHAETLIRAARAIDARRCALEYEVAVEEGHDLPRHAAARHWDASSVLRNIGERFIDLADQHAFAARRYEAKQADEDRGVGDAA